MNILQNLRFKERLPVLGIVAFSACSINSVANLFLSRARHPTPFLWGAAGLVEIVTAWIIFQVVENARKITKSNISKQDRRFYGGVLGAFTILAVPPLALSIVANSIEFDNVGLGIIFPLLSVACAVGSALPETVQKFEKSRENANLDAQKEKERKRKEKERKEHERRGQAQAREMQEQRQLEQELVKRLESLGNAVETLRQYAGNPKATQASVAQELGISRQAVGQHLRKLEQANLVKRDGQGIEVLIDLGGNGVSQNG